MKLYLAYGANLNKQSMSHRCPDAVAVQPVYLQGWSLAFSGVATIRPNGRGCVAGALWAISDADEQSLDHFEGYPDLYRKEVVRVDDMDVMVYVMNGDYPSEPSTGYLMTIAQGYQDWKLDIDYLAQAVKNTQQEIYDYDLQWSTRIESQHGDSSADLADCLYLESRDDLRWLRDQWCTNRFPHTME